MSTTAEKQRKLAKERLAKPSRKRRGTTPLNATKQDPKKEPGIHRVVRLNVMHRRESLDLSQRDLAEMIGSSQAYLSHIERADHKQRPNLLMLEKLARGLNCTPADLLVPGKFKKAEKLKY